MSKTIRDIIGLHRHDRKALDQSDANCNQTLLTFSVVTHVLRRMRHIT